MPVVNEDASHAFSNRGGYVALAIWVTVLGVFLILAPQSWFGPSWSYFSDHGLPVFAGGLGMGSVLTAIGSLQLILLWRNTTRYLASLFFLSGFVFWTAAIILFAEGLLGHQGLMEAPLMGYLGVHKFVVMAALMVEDRRQKADR